MKNKDFSFKLLLALSVSLSLLLSGCGLWGVGKWSAHSVTLFVHDKEGQPIEGATVSTITQQDQKTDKNGKAVVYYETKGLYVITISAEGKETTQIKVTMPVDDGREIFIQLAPVKSLIPPPVTEN